MEDTNLDVVNAQAKKKNNEEFAPVWIKIFGGSILSVSFLCAITVTGYIVNNLNSLQSQINTLNSQMVTKSEHNERQKLLWDSYTTQTKQTLDALSLAKERLNSLEQSIKDRQISIDKLEAKDFVHDKVLENANKELVSQKEKFDNLNSVTLQLRDEIKAVQKDIQNLREKVATIEAKK